MRRDSDEAREGGLIVNWRKIAISLIDRCERSRNLFRRTHPRSHHIEHP
jgi:hypothetical protein